MSVAKAILPNSHLVGCIKKGKQALSKAARAAVVESASTKVVDSIDLDAATANELPDENRWDYLLGVRGRAAGVIAVEIHPATAREVKKIIAKKKAALAYLVGHCKKDSSAPGKWHWIASGTVALPRTTSAYRELVKAGIHFAGTRLNL